MRSWIKEEIQAGARPEISCGRVIFRLQPDSYLHSVVRMHHKEFKGRDFSREVYLVYASGAWKE